MSKARGGTLLLAGAFLVFLGFLIQSDFLTWLLDILGVVTIIVGAVLGIIGLIQVFSGGGGGRTSGDDYDY